MTLPIRVVLADDHPSVRAGVRAILEATLDITVVGEASNGDEVLPLCHGRKPNVLLLDLHMSGTPPLITVSQLQVCEPQIQVVVLSADNDPTIIRSMYAVGIAGYVLKDEALKVVVDAIRSVVHGTPWSSKAVVDKVLRLGCDATAQPEQLLSERELTLVQLIIANRTNQQIADACHLSVKTVEKHLTLLFKKLGVGGRLEVALVAMRLGLGRVPA